jgi:tyrosinase
MSRIRVDVWNTTRAEGDWPAVLTAYERAVGLMRDLDPPAGKPSNPLGWRFQAAIHGLESDLGGPDTSNDQWSMCQHGSWFFLPWHRMYLAAFERIVQHVLGDHTWALPYWYSIDPDDPGKAVLPPAFLDLTLADNNLQTEERSQTAKAGLPFYGDIDPVLVGETVLDTLGVPAFSSPSGQSTFGGGERSSLSFDGGERGSLENVPHGAPHSLVGNDYDEFGNLVDPGWMGSFYTAGLDPIFWLHHCNIDRLWQVWLELDPGHANPTGDPAFMDTTFTFPDPVDGTVTWSIAEALDTEFFGYVYESLAAPAALAPPPPPPPPPSPPEPDEGTRTVIPEAAMSSSLPPQVLGAASNVSLATDESVAVELEQPRRGRGADDAGPGPRVYLRVEGVTGTNAAPLYGVYLNVPEGEDPRSHPELRAGSFSTFGLAETSQTNEQHDAEGLSAVFDVTGLRDRLAAEDRWDPGRVDVRFSTELPRALTAPTPEGEAAESRRPDLRARRIAVVVD